MTESKNQKAVPVNLLTSNTILYCQKWAQTVSFYRDLLALPVLFENDWFVEFALNKASRLSIADESRATIKSNQGAGFTLALEVNEIEALWEQIENAGLNLTTIQEHPWNARVFYFFDPEGHRIEMWQKSAGTT
jgi:catechol 2,3-dioxygenase-like lactoylglutathione lyase family enzyme